MKLHALLPGLWETSLGTSYSNAMNHITEQWFDNPSLGNVGVIVLWSLVLMVIYGILEFLMGSYRDLHNARREVQFIDERPHLNDALSRWIWGRAIWRFGISLIGVLVLFLLRSPIHHVSAVEYNLVSQLPGRVSAWQIAKATLLWIGIYHVGVVLLRLYAYRTRLFGDSSLY